VKTKTSTRIFPVIGIALVFLVVVSARARAQSLTTGAIVGSIQDATGAAVPKAQVTVLSKERGFTRRTESNAQGYYAVPQLDPGNYIVTVQAPGFQTISRENITTAVSRVVNVDFQVQVGSVSEQVIVRTDAMMVDSQSGTLRKVVTERDIASLPLNGRNAAELVFMAPGVVSGKGQTPATYANQASEARAISVNGTYGNQVSYKLDGASHQDSISGLNAVFPNPDALAEFSVQTNNFDARYGGSAGAVVNIVTKTGTNQFHGSVFEYLRNGALNARNSFAPQRDNLKRNQFGGVFGGPIVRDKLFFFASYQGTIVRNISFGQVAFVPSQAMRQGDFSSMSKTIKDPQTGKAFSGNRIPGNRISPIAQNALAKVPLSSDPTGKLLYAVPANFSKHQALGKINYNAGRNMLAASIFYDWYGDQGWNGAGTLLNYRLGQLQTTKEFNVSDTYTITPGLLNTAVFDALILNSTQTRTAPFSIFDFGDIRVAKPAPEFLETQINVSGFPGWGGGGPAPPGRWLRNNFEVSDMLTYIRGGHSMHIGVELNPNFKFDSKTGFQEEPTFSFSGQSGNALADFLLGYVTTFTQTAGKAKFTRGKQIRAYFQDDWRIRKSFTLNLGLRWDPYFPPNDPVAHQVGGYIPGFRSQRFPNAPLGLAFDGDLGFPAAGFHNNLGNFAPRLGFAWEVRGGPHVTTVRGAWGKFYVTPLVRIYNNFVENAPFSPAVQLFGVSLSDPYGSANVTNPFPPFAPVNPAPNTKFSLPVKFAFINPNWTLGHVEAWNLTVEHQFTNNFLLRVAYVADRGVRLQYTEERNAAIFRPNATLRDTDQRRPLSPNFASLLEMTNGGTSNYHSVQLNLEKRFSRQFSFVANYTFSKSLDNQSFDPQFQLVSPSPFDRMFNYGLSDFDTPHNFSYWSIWELPNLQRSSRVVKTLFGSWSVNSIWTWRSGTPFTIVSGRDRSFSGVGLDRADLVGNPFLRSGQSRAQMIDQYFNTSAFELNAPGTFGSSPRNLLRSPRWFNVDFGLARAIPITESVRVQLRGEFFNLFNNVHLNQPGTNISAPSTFGKINSAGDPRIVQVGIKVQF